MVATDRATREVLRLHDLQLLATASYFDLADPAERVRSTDELELLFFRLLKVLQPDLFLEAGAKEAGASRRARRRLPNATIIAFEANPETHKRFSGNEAHERHQVDYRHQALSSEPGTVTFNVRLDRNGQPMADGQGSLLRRDDHRPGHQEVEVEATTIDAVFEESGAQSMAMWVDVEGAAEAVLGGATDAMKHTLAAFVEVEDHEFWPGQWLSGEVAAFFFDAGLTPVARDFQSPRQSNVIFVRNDRIDTAPSRQALAGYHSAANQSLDLSSARVWLNQQLTRVKARLPR